MRPSRVSPRHERLGHRRQRLPVRVGDGAGHGLGLIVLVGCGQRPGYLRWTSCAATRSTAPAPVARVPGRRRSGLRAADPVRLPAGPERRGTLTCKQAAARLGRHGWEVRSAGTGSKGHRWYAWAWLATASARYHLLIRRHLTTGELAYHYCYLPEGQPASPSRPIRVAGLRWPAEEDFEFGKDCFGLDQSQVRLYTAIARRTVLVMAAVAICAVTAALLRLRRRPRRPPPCSRTGLRRPGHDPAHRPGNRRLLGHPPPPGSAAHWLDWRRRHQACSRWYHQRTRLALDTAIILVS